MRKDCICDHLKTLKIQSLGTSVQPVRMEQIWNNIRQARNRAVTGIQASAPVNPISRGAIRRQHSIQKSQASYSTFLMLTSKNLKRF